MAARRRLYAALLLAALAGTAAPQDHFAWSYPQTRVRNSGILDIKLIRATTTNLYVQASCYPACLNITWECSSLDSYSKADFRVEVEEQGNGIYALRNLTPGLDYSVTASMGRGYDQIRARTCSGHLTLYGLRAGRNGPGWLDIRWPPVHAFACRGDVEYRVRHRVDAPGAEFTPWREFGAYPVDSRGTLHVGPSHPCEDYPREFCLLLTDGVRAAQGHVVEIQPRLIGGTVFRKNTTGGASPGDDDGDHDRRDAYDRRRDDYGDYGGRRVGYGDFPFGGMRGFGFGYPGFGFPGISSDEGNVETVWAFADPDNTLAPNYLAGVHPECVTWAWVTVGANVVAFFIIMVGLLNGVVTTYQKTQMLRKDAENAENEENGQNEGTEENAENVETSFTAETRETEESREDTGTGKREESDNAATSRQ